MHIKSIPAEMVISSRTGSIYMTIFYEFFYTGLYNFHLAFYGFCLFTLESMQQKFAYLEILIPPPLPPSPLPPTHSLTSVFPRELLLIGSSTVPPQDLFPFRRFWLIFILTCNRGNSEDFWSICSLFTSFHELKLKFSYPFSQKITLL